MPSNLKKEGKPLSRSECTISINNPGEGNKLSDTYIRIILGLYGSSLPQIHVQVFSLQADITWEE